MRLSAGFLLLAISMHGQAFDTAETLQQLVWNNRVLVIFAPTIDDALLKQQNSILSRVSEGLQDRDMVVIRASAGGNVTVDNELQGNDSRDIYRHFSTAPDSFRVVLVGKDGTVKLSQFAPVTATALFDLIDAMPMRQQEMLREHK